MHYSYINLFLKAITVFKLFSYMWHYTNILESRGCSILDLNSSKNKICRNIAQNFKKVKLSPLNSLCSFETLQVTPKNQLHFQMPHIISQEPEALLFNSISR